MPTYSLDPLHPDRLRCDQCGATVAEAPPNLAATEGLTCRQLALAGLEPATLLALAAHDLLCRAWAEAT
jgi:hypothetical protein